MSSIQITKVDGNLGLVSAPSAKSLVVGPASTLSTRNTLYTFAQIKDVAATIGYGPAQDWAEGLLKAGAPSVMVLNATGSNAGAILSSSVHSDVGVLTVAGTPYHSYDFTGVVTKAGYPGTTDIGTARMKYSLDGGETYTEEFTMTGSLALQHTGLTLTFSAVTQSIGNTFAFTALAPTMSTADVSAAFDAFKVESIEPLQIVIAQDTNSSSLAAALHTTVDSFLTTLDSDRYNIFTEAVLPAGGIDRGTSATIASWASKSNSTGNGIAVVAERARYAVATAIPGRSNPLLPFALAVAQRQQINLISTPTDRVNDGALTGWEAPTYDERIDGIVYETAKLVAPTTFQGTGGIYVNKSKLLSAFGSDYKFMEWSRVLNRAAQVTVAGLRRFLNDVFRTIGEGTMAPQDIARVEGYINKQLKDALERPLNVNGFPGHVNLGNGPGTGVRFALNPNANILTTGIQDYTVVLVPLAKVENFVGSIGFSSGFAAPAAPPAA